MTGQSETAAAALESKNSGTNQLLYHLEAGRLAQIAGATALSKAAFEHANDFFIAKEDAARIRASSLGRGTSAMLTNDNALQYKGEPFERIFGQTFQAINYLMDGDMTGASVEFRRVDHTQRNEEQRHTKEISKASNAEHDAKLSQYDGYFEGLNTAAAQVRSSIQNAYSYYLSGAFWEGTGNYNNALVSYKQAFQIVPSAEFLTEDIARVSRRLDGRVYNKGLIVIAYEQGFVPQKQEIALPIPTAQGVISLSFPIYDGNRFTSSRPLRLRIDDQYVTTHAMANVGAIAARALKEKVPAMLTRQILRMTVKYTMQKKANDQSPLAGFATQIYNLLSEQADLRSWLTLPANAQIARLEVAAGDHQLQLPLAGNTELLSIPVEDGGVTLVHIIDTGGKVTHHILPIHQ